MILEKRKYSDANEKGTEHGGEDARRIAHGLSNIA
jgi:hypothetical protein